MAEIKNVVAHYLDGTVVHGTTLNFFPNRPKFHLNPHEGGDAVEIQCSTLKAVFFVKDAAGNPQREDLRGFIAGPAETTQGRKVAVHFKDGELLCGYTLGYTAEREGFMLFPADTGSNNIRVYIMRNATVDVKLGPAAEALAEKTLQSAKS